MSLAGRYGTKQAREIQSDHPDDSLPTEWDPKEPYIFWRPQLQNFPTVAFFDDHKEAVEWINKQTASHGFGVTIAASHKGRKTKSTPFPLVNQCYLWCAKGRQKDQVGYEKTGNCPHVGSRMVDCPWWAEIKLKTVMNDEQYYRQAWVVIIHCDIHNHKKSGCIALPHFHQVDDFARGIIMNRARNNNPVGDIHTNLLRHGHSNLLKRDVQNVMNQYRLQSLNGMTPIQALLHLLENHTIYGPRSTKMKYLYKAKKDNQGRLHNIFFAHPASFALLKDNPDVFLLDCTYKINRFNMPFLHIVGSTCLEKNFDIAFDFMPGEKDPDYIIAITNLQELCVYLGVWPSVFITDNYSALKKALREIFPYVPQRLCLWHMNNNLKVRMYDEWDIL
jgi:hypothetical protein